MTSKPSVFVSRVIPDAGLSLLRENFDVTVWPHDRPPTRQELTACCQGKDALVCLLTEKVDAELLAAAPAVKIVANVAVGFDNLDVAAGTRAGVVMSNTPGVLDETTADLAFALLMASARRVVEADRLVRTGTWAGWGIMQYLGHDIHHATLGIVGLGRIGKAVARRAAGFAMNVLYADAAPAGEDVEKELRARFVPLKDLLRESDFVSLHVPLMEQTHHLIDASALKLMKKSAHLINTSRGPVVDEKALVDALNSGTIAGAGLDVYENEPMISSELLALPNVVLLPHIASASHATRGKMSEVAARNVIAFFNGGPLPTPLNPEAFKVRSAVS
ncbi:MAG: D-glycerate dehydrogenase [Candidatus Eremiobacteraeota bacterium]|nr:D-glycerate dehydrogenase [Candidatus Eremiobacteraeota bacterium]MBC5827127.1 D-glycerate dehydrogenase [Candidatus Eremiobacteraeota bacterium]